MTGEQLEHRITQDRELMNNVIVVNALQASLHSGYDLHECLFWMIKNLVDVNDRLIEDRLKQIQTQPTTFFFPSPPGDLKK